MKIREILESATAGATSAGNVAIGAVYKNKPGKTAKNKPIDKVFTRNKCYPRGD